MFKKGYTPWNKGKKGYTNAGSFVSRDTEGTKNNKWKGDKVGYFGLHTWVHRKLGRPTSCTHCGSKGKKNGRNWSIHWANKSQEYLRDIEDWIPLCISCHIKYDMTQEWKDNISKSKIGHIPWNKGLKGFQFHTQEWKEEARKRTLLRKRYKGTFV